MQKKENIFVLSLLKTRTFRAIFVCLLSSFLVRTQKDSDKAIYQTLVRKGRRGSLNNARRRYEDKMNIRKVRQHMQNITVVENEEKLMEMSKVIESAPGKFASILFFIAKLMQTGPPNKEQYNFNRILNTFLLF